MRNTKALWLPIVALLVASPVRASEVDEKAVAEAARHFYVAVNDMFTGNLEPMKEVWSHADDVTYMGPGGGLEVGWEKVLAAWEVQAAKKLGGAIKSERTHTVVASDVAITQSYEIGENLDSAGKTQKVSIRATNVFRKEDGQWKVIGHHTDLLPFLEK